MQARRPGTGRYRFVANRDREASWAMIYAPVGREFTVRTGLLPGETLHAWCFNPRNGKAVRSESIRNAETHRFRTPDHGEGIDWVLVLDDSSRHYPVPGTAAAQ